MKNYEIYKTTNFNLYITQYKLNKKIIYNKIRIINNEKRKKI